MKTLLPLLALTVTISSAPAATPDWAQFRGPGRDGVSAEKGLLSDWPKDGPKLAWKINGLGKGLSSVAIADGKIFTMGQRQDGQYLIVFDLQTQKELWATRVSEQGDSPNGTPCVDQGLVYAISKDGKLICCQTADGQEVWRKDLVGDLGGKMMSGWGYSESPLVDGEKLIVTPGGDEALLAALNKKTGAVIWKTEKPAGFTGRGQDGAGYTGAVVSAAAGVRQYVTLLGRGAIGVAAKDGKPLWYYTRVANGTANIPTPLAWDDYVFVSSGYGTGAALLKIVKSESDARPAPAVEAKKVDDLKAKVAELKSEIEQRREVRGKTERGTPEFDKANEAVQSIKPEIEKAENALAKAQGASGNDSDAGRVSGSPLAADEQYFLNASTFQNHHGGMVRIGDYIYAGTGHNNGFPICLEWKTGKVVWNKERGPGKESAAVIAADGRLYFRYQDGIMALIEASPKGYAEHGVFKLPSVDGPSWPHPAIQNGKLFLRDNDTLMCYDIRK